MPGDERQRSLLRNGHIIAHAAREPIFGFRIIEELARHGYKLNPGTLYPLLHGLERKGYYVRPINAARDDRVANIERPRLGAKRWKLPR